jgi:hypothetical protein
MSKSRAVDGNATGGLALVIGGALMGEEEEERRLCDCQVGGGLIGL